MEKTGKVTEIKGENMVVRIIRDSACGENCKACGLCGGGREMTLTFKNKGGFRVGDDVRLTSSDKAFLRNSALGYLPLTLLLIVGGAIGGFFGGEWGGFLGAIIGTAVGLILLKGFFTENMEVKIEKIER